MPAHDSRTFAIEVARIVQDHKGNDVVALDLRGISQLTDFVVISTGTSARQMAAIADQVTLYGRKVNEKPFGVHGYGTDTWVILDFVDVVLHLFTKKYREYYDIELLWGDAPRLEFSRSATA